MIQKLPPLNALKAFEAAARSGSYVGAAEELGVSAAAVSQQVRNLEGWFGKRLFVRFNNRIALTDAGMAIYQDTSAPLQEIAGMAARVLGETARARLVVSTLPSLAERWLAPRLAEFAQAAPEISIDLRVEEDPVDLMRNEVDLRLCYTAQFYPDYQVLPLFRDEVLPICAPGFWDAHGPDIATLPDPLLIHTDWGPSFASHPSWADWFAAAGLERTPSAAEGHRVMMSSTALELAQLGMGLALGQRSLAASALKSGHLVAPLPRTLSLGHDYCAVHAHARAGRRGLAALVDLLRDGPN
ncbi:MAG: LysR substrate-binding domain-containing protein [Paracoccaceae bacterium]|nr:LysR substrate-binding domain-containing protein [Paracoccaceae bacterium]